MTRFQWRLAILVASAIAVSYLDRQTLPVAISAIQREIPVSNTQFSNLQSAFLFAYALMYAAGGRLIDVVGTRWGFFSIMLWWSLACASHGLARSVQMLGISRFLLGMGEGGAFPATTKVISEWFHPAERTTAMGIMNGGSAVGAVIAPPAIAFVILHYGWRAVFVIAGAVGVLWTLWWMRVYRPAETPANDAPPPRVPWLSLFRYRQTWALVAAKFLSDGAWFFYLFWLPKYLYDARGFDIKSVGALAWIPYAASGVGCVAGGWFSSYLVKSGRSFDFARKMALGLSMAIMPLVILVTHVPVATAIVIFSLAFLGHQSWSTVFMILPADIYPYSTVGSIAGLAGFGGAIGGVACGFLAGQLLDHGFGYQSAFGIFGTFHFIAFLIVIFVVGRIQPLAFKA